MKITTFSSKKSTMRENLGRNIEISMSKWKLKGEGFMHLFPDHRYMSGTFSSWKNGIRTPPVDFILRLSDITGISPQRLWRTVISDGDLPDRPILNQKNTDEIPTDLISTDESLSVLMRIPELLNRVEKVEEEIKNLKKKN